MVMIKVMPGEAGTLEVEIPYDMNAVAKIKTIPGRVWVPPKKVWTIPFEGDTLDLLRMLFADDNLNIAPSLVSSISEVTRRDIIDYLIVMKPPFNGRLPIIEFLSRIWDLSQIPSTDSRFKNAKDDIWQHMVNNYDWDDHFLFYDYFHMLDVSDDTFLKLVEEVVNPSVRADSDDVLKVVAHLNDMLAPDGYSLRVERRISGRPLYKAVPSDSASHGSDTSFEVVLSFAGEERPFVQQAATYLKSHGVKCFYDEDEAVDMWGKDLTEHLDAVYAGNAKYCVMFISENYARKMWTTHERRSALAKAVKQTGEYILPVRFDGTPLAGIRHTIAYIDAVGKTPDEIAKLIIAKLTLLHNP